MNPPPDHCGNLQKVGGKVIRKLQTRWCELQGCILSYYKSKPRSQTERPQGTIDLRNTACVLFPKEGPFAWAVTGPNLRKQYIFIACNESEMQQWIVKLEAATLKTPQGAFTEDCGSDDDTSSTALMFPGMDGSINLQSFEVLKTLGKGSYGLVSLVRKKDSGHVYALKELDKAQIARERLAEHVLSERQILMRVSHPFIVKLHYTFQTEASLYLVLDYLSGGDLENHLTKEKTFTESRCKFYVAEISLALSHLHSVNIVYRDLKPENVVVDKEGHVKVADFGLAKTNVSGTGARTFCGTPEYVAPEIILGDGHGTAVDWWSLGILTFRMLTGSPPFTSSNVNELYEMILRKPIDFSKFTLSPAAEDFIRQLLERNVMKRLQSITAVKSHPFFADIDWERVLSRSITPPFIPTE
eukprot:PhF_6_TR5761/c0_g1_i1/m.8496